MIILEFLLGFLSGLFAGVILMCLVQINRENKYFSILKAIKKLAIVS